jgi:hypothetical protein
MYLHALVDLHVLPTCSSTDLHVLPTCSLTDLHVLPCCLLKGRLVHCINIVPLLHRANRQKRQSVGKVSMHLVSQITFPLRNIFATLRIRVGSEHTRLKRKQGGINSWITAVKGQAASTGLFLQVGHKCIPKRNAKPKRNTIPKRNATRMHT